MSTVKERFSQYIDEGSELFKRYNMNSISSLKENYKNNIKFKEDWKNLWKKIEARDGGKIGWGTAGAIVGYMLGGVGIAAMGGAVGVPLLIVLGLGGVCFGATRDAPIDTISIEIAKTTYQKIERDAKHAEMSIDGFLDFLVTQYSEEKPD